MCLIFLSYSTDTGVWLFTASYLTWIDLAIVQVKTPRIISQRLTVVNLPPFLNNYTCYPCTEINSFHLPRYTDDLAAPVRHLYRILLQFWQSIISSRRLINYQNWPYQHSLPLNGDKTVTCRKIIFTLVKILNLFIHEPSAFFNMNTLICLNKMSMHTKLMCYI